MVKIGIIIVTTLSLIIGIGLVIASLTVTSEESVYKELEKLLPGYNCNSCGFTNCANYSKELYNNPLLDRCKFLKDEDKEKIKLFFEERKKK